MRRAIISGKAVPAAIQDELSSLGTGYRSFQPQLALAAAYSANGDNDKAKAVINEFVKTNAKHSVAWFQDHLPNLINWPPEMLPALRKAGLPQE